jgi:hypothetical protein
VRLVKPHLRALGAAREQLPGALSSRRWQRQRETFDAIVTGASAKGVFVRLHRIELE